MDKLDDIGCKGAPDLVMEILSSATQRDEAVDVLCGIAENGDPHTQYLMGKLYRHGPLLIPAPKKALDVHPSGGTAKNTPPVLCSSTTMV